MPDYSANAFVHALILAPRSAPEHRSAELRSRAQLVVPSRRLEELSRPSGRPRTIRWVRFDHGG
jgi:hypothetical protein